jgi:DNA phosphorothioation-dependent restriction protein DptG
VSNHKKALQLGEPIGTASHKLRKLILFSLIVELGRNKCFQCQEEIKEVSTLSIEHKEPWLDSESPKEKFFDLENIAFSHISCNIGAARKPTKLTVDQRRKKWADDQKKYYTPERRRNKYLTSGH